jgi:RND family efflux transporter MFP subunit
MSRLIVFAAAVLSAAPCLPSPAGAAELEVTRATVAETKAVFGRVESRNVVAARARIGGTIETIEVSEGTEVGEGQVIGLVVDAKIALQRSAALARIEELRSQLDNARTELERAEELLKRGVTAQSRLDQARTRFDVAVNQEAVAEADLAVLDQQAREGEVLAPAGGRVLTVPVTEGSVILPGEPIARIASGGYFLRLSLPERHAAEIAEGDEVLIGERGLAPVDGAAPADQRRGRIAKVYPEIEAGRVIADVEVASLGDYFVGERTLVWIPIGKRETILVPSAAVTTRHGIDYVRLLTGGAELEVAVILGETFEDGEGPQVEILSGLVEGDRIAAP